jgi:hypothetical protein
MVVNSRAQFDKPRFGGRPVPVEMRGSSEFTVTI